MTAAADADNPCQLLILLTVLSMGRWRRHFILHKTIYMLLKKKQKTLVYLVCLHQISGASSLSRQTLTFLQDGRRSQTWPVSTTGTFLQAPPSGRGLPPVKHLLDRRSRRPWLTTQPQHHVNTPWARSAPHPLLTMRWEREQRTELHTFWVSHES